MESATQNSSTKYIQPLKSSTLGAPSKHITNDPFRAIYFSLLIFIAVSFCEVIWKSSNNQSFQKIGYLLYPISFLIFFLSSILSIFRYKLGSLCTQGHLTKVLLYMALLTVLLAYGLLRGNIINAVIHEVILFYSFAIFLILGVDDRICNSIIKLLTVVFWAAFILSLLTFDIQGPSASIFQEEGIKAFDIRYRYSNSIAHHFFRPFLHVGLPLFIHGWLEKRGRWHYFQIFTLVGYLLVNVAIFKYRGSLAISSLVVLAALMMPSSFSKKFKIAFLVVMVFIGASGWIYTESGNKFMERLNKFDSSKKVADYRLPEAEAFFKMMGYKWLWGQGLGATYYAKFSANPKDSSNTRTGLHIGWVSFTLKGGLPLLLIVLAFFLAAAKKNKKRLGHDLYYTVAKFWIPILFVNWVVNPISLHAVNVPVYGLSFLLMARFGKQLTFDRE